MARYEYECPSCAGFEATHPIGAAPEEAGCPRCGAPSRRVFSPPLLAATPPRVDRLRGREERSREQPEVVTTVPPASGDRRPRPHNPMHARLPRP